VISRTVFTLWILFSFLAAPPLQAVDPSRRVSQFAHTAWRTHDGAFRGAAFAITQTADGYIWIGTQSELLRFDGIRFVPWVSSDATQLPSGEIESLLGASDGSLWIGTSAGLSHWTNQHLVNESDAKGVITSIFEDQDRSIWFTHVASLDGSGTLCHETLGKVMCYGRVDGIPALAMSNSLTMDSSGSLWIGGDTALVRWNAGSSSVYSPPGIKANEGMLGVSGFALDADGSMWAGYQLPGPEMGLQHFVQGKWKPFVTSALDGRRLEVTTLFMDRHGTLWIGTTNKGIYRIHGKVSDHFGAADGLSSDLVNKFYEDREGNVWVVTSRGLDRFSDLQVATYSTREGLTSEEVDSVLAARDGTLWIGEAGALDALSKDRVSSIRPKKELPGSQVTSLLEDHQGRLWVGIDSNLWVYDKRLFHKIAKPDGTSFGVIVSMSEDTARNIWLEIGEPKRVLIRIRDDRVQEVYPASRLPPARQVTSDPGGGIWLGTRRGELVRYRGDQAETFAFNKDTHAQVDQVLVVSDGSVLGTTSSGLIGWKDGKKQTLTVSNGLPCNGVLSIIFDKAGTLWVVAQCGLIKISGDELRKWWQDPESTVKVTFFDELDGFQPGWAPFQKTARTPDGRLWFANGAVLQMIDPDHLYKNALSPPVHVESVTADQRIYPTSQEIHLPALTRDLQIDYTALSYIAPQKVQFRYKLEGHDLDWQSPGTRRQAFYNNLGPGTFTFHVIACNNDGVWNDVGAALTLIIGRTWYQTTWFRISWILSLCLLLAASYRARVQYIARDMSAKFDERLSERTRLAMDLHDTFLQTVQGSKMVADDALDSTADQLHMRHALEKLSVWLGQAVAEGRAALQALHVPAKEKNYLVNFLTRIANQHCPRTSISVMLSVTGEARDLHPIVQDEISRIAEEGIRNVCLHSSASNLRIEIRYSRDLELCLKDDGIGIDPEVMSKGKAGHFGIQGMKKRAARIRAKLSIVSDRNMGTNISLTVPGDVVYRRKKRGLVAGIRSLKLWRVRSIDQASKTEELEQFDSE
jgi:signal transduction histidine kinase/ligand-binding sensor domain-containing protein